MGTVAAYIREKTLGRIKFFSNRLLYRRPFAIRTEIPVISFTFDDFPRSAYLEGAAILNRFGVAGTYYVSLGLMGKQGPPGPMFQREDLLALHERGHELGCHTFGHCHSWETPPDVFERSVLENREALCKILPGVSFKTLSYPVTLPRPETKRRMAKYFACCRGGGHTYNSGISDLNCLKAYFLERGRENPAQVKDLIDRNCRARGWLILDTHDICQRPSPYGCTPRFFEEIVGYAASSGARILTVAQARELLNGGPLSSPVDSNSECPAG